MRIALVAPVAQPLPPPRSGSVETVTGLLADGLVARGHHVTLFATKNSATTAQLHTIFERGYHEDLSIWPWELCELFNLAEAVKRSDSFDVIHHQAEYSPIALAYDQISPTPLVQTVHHTPSSQEIALWAKHRQIPFVAISAFQASHLSDLNVVGIVHHALNLSHFQFNAKPQDYLLFLGRFTEGKGVLQAIHIARRTGHRLVLAAAENDYYRNIVAPLVDENQICYAGEVDHQGKVKLLGNAKALIYPIQSPEPFGLVLAEAMACGTPIAALNRGAVSEIVDDGISGMIFTTIDALVAGLPTVLTLDRHRVRNLAEERFGVDRMVDAHIEVYRRIAQSGLEHPNSKQTA